MDQKQFAQKYPLAVKSGKNDEVDPTFAEFLHRDDNAKNVAKINKDEFEKDYEALKKSGFNTLSDDAIKKGAEVFKREVQNSQKSINEDSEKKSNKDLFINKNMKNKKNMKDIMKKVRRDEYSEIAKTGSLKSNVFKNKKKYDRKSNKPDFDELNESEGNSNEENFYVIYAGLGGGFGGASLDGIEYCTKDEAEESAVAAANETYSSYEGSHGIRTIEEIMEEDEVDEEEAEQIYSDERESWLDYHVELYDPEKLEDKEGYSPQDLLDGNYVRNNEEEFKVRFIDSKELNESEDEEEELNEERSEDSYAAYEFQTLYEWINTFGGKEFLIEKGIKNPAMLMDFMVNGKLTAEEIDIMLAKKSDKKFSELPLWKKVKQELNINENMNENRLTLTKGQLLEMSINTKSVPGLYITDRVKRANKDINKSELNNVFTKLEFMEKMQKDKNQIPKFNTLDEEYIETEGGGMQDLKYDNEPSKEWKNKQKKNIGDNDVAKKMMEKAKKRKELMDNRPYYKKDVQPTSNKAPQKSTKGLAFESEIPQELKVNGKHFVIEHEGVEYELIYQNDKLNVLRETKLEQINESVEKMKKLMGYNTTHKKHKINEDALIKKHLDTVRKKLND